MIIKDCENMNDINSNVVSEARQKIETAAAETAIEENLLF